MWILQHSSSSRRVTFRIAAGAVKTVGRAPRADFIVDAPLVSRLHCRFEATRDSLHVVDLGSTNGTWVNGRRIRRARLQVGDGIRVGEVELRVSSHGDTPPITPDAADQNTPAASQPRRNGQKSSM
jgi:pSer/pThr/pTyr-binding forkhead associated (FHA) protein